VTLSVQVLPYGSGTPTGTVTFFDGTTNLGSKTLDGTGSAALTTSALGLGMHSITVSYAGNANFTASLSPAASIQVDLGTTTGLMISTTSPDFGDSAQLTATVAPTSGTGTPTGSVIFYAGTLALGAPVPLSGGTAQATFTNIPGGSSR
jgi:hypothetical protein